MTQLFNIDSEIDRLRRERLRKSGTELVQLGDGRGTDEKNFYADLWRVWVRPIGSDDGTGTGYASLGTPFTVLGGTNYLPEFNQQVRIYWDDDEQDLAILKPDLRHMIETKRSSHLLNAHDPHNQFVRQEQLMTLLAEPVGGMLVKVGQWLYELDDGTAGEWQATSAAAGTHVDLTPAVPATAGTHRLALVYFDIDLHQADDYPLALALSTPKAIGIDVDDTDRAECRALLPHRSRSIKSFRVEAGQTQLRGTRFDRDMRHVINVPLAIPGGFIAGAMIQDDAIDIDHLANDVLHIDVVAPTVTDDIDLGYAVGSRWIDTVTDKEYVCTDNTNGAAVWIETTGSSGMASFTVAGDTGTPFSIADADTLTFEGTGGITTSVDDVTQTVTIDGSGITGGITELTGDVTAGPGSGSQATTIANNAITQVKMADASVGTAEIIDASITNAKIVSLDASTKLTGITPMANGGTGANNAVTGFDNLAPTTTIGDLIYHDGTDNTRLPKGTANQQLRVNAAATAPEWFTPPSATLDVLGATGEGWAANDDLYLDTASNTWFKIDTNAVPIKIGPVRGVGVATASHPSSGNVIRLQGLVTGYTGLTAGAPLYASTTPGGYTQTKPSVSAGGGQVVIAEMAFAITTTTAFISPKRLQYIKRESLANAATLSLTHHSDAPSHSRVPRAYIASSTIEVKETYATSNQDTAIQLRGQSGAGQALVIDSAGASANALGDNGTNDVRHAQSFQITAGRLSAFMVRFGATTGTPSQAPNWSIQTDNAGIPSGIVLASGTMNTITPNADNTVTVTNGPFLSAATTYWLVLELPLQASTNFYAVNRNGANPYANGVQKLDNSVGASFPGTWNGLAAGSDMRCSITTTAVLLNDKIAQGTSHASTATLSYVDLYLKRTGTLSGDLTCAIYNDTAGSPGSVITNGTATVIAASTVTTGYTLIRFTFPVQPSISASTPYHISLSTTDTASNTAYIEWGVDASSPSYANGAIKLEIAAAWSSASPAADGCFVLYGLGTTYDQPVDVGFGAPVMEAYFADTSLANQDTVTTFENVYGVTVDVACIVEME